MCRWPLWAHGLGKVAAGGSLCKASFSVTSMASQAERAAVPLGQALFQNILRKITLKTIQLASIKSHRFFFLLFLTKLRLLWLFSLLMNGLIPLSVIVGR